MQPDGAVCPGTPQAIRLLQARPAMPFGIHLTLVRDSSENRWEPLSPRQMVPSLLDESGELFIASPAGRDALLGRARLSEVEREFRAQINTVVDAGLAPTHLDFHCLADCGRADILDLAMALAREYRLATRVWLAPGQYVARQRGLPVVDNEFVDSFSLELQDKPARYAELLHALPAGLTEWAVHPSVSGEESDGIDNGWQVRRTDYEFLVSPAARELVCQERIHVIDYTAIQRAWASAAGCQLHR